MTLILERPTAEELITILKSSVECIQPALDRATTGSPAKFEPMEDMKPLRRIKSCTIVRPTILKHCHSQGTDEDCVMTETVLVSLKPDCTSDQDAVEQSARLFTDMCNALGEVSATDMRMKPGETLISITFGSQLDRENPYACIKQALERGLDLVGIKTNTRATTVCISNNVVPEDIFELYASADRHLVLNGNSYLVKGYSTTLTSNYYSIDLINLGPA